MGNTLAQFYAPPSPPTPLSSDKYFWINARDINVGLERSSGEGDNDRHDREHELPTTRSSHRDIPVIYIRRDATTAASSDHREEEEVDAEEEEGEAEKREGAPSSSEGGARCHRTTLLYCHGHDVDLGAIHDFLVRLSKSLDADILSFDYSGYGPSLRGRSGRGYDIDRVQLDNDASADGRAEKRGGSADVDAAMTSARALPTEADCCSDARACFDYLVRQRGVPPASIVLYGKGLGTGPACHLARELCDGAASVRASKEGSISATPNSTKSAVPPCLGGLVLHSAFRSVLRLRLGSFSLPLGYIGGDAFDSDEALRGMHDDGGSVDGPGYALPVYFIHGNEDTVVPIGHGRALCELVMERRKRGFPPFWADGGNHWNIERKYATAYIKRLQQFLRHCSKANAAANGPDQGREKSSGRRSSGDGRADVRGGPTIEDRRGRCADGPNGTAMVRRRGRSSGRARQRKKKGTLVMRGALDEDVTGDELGSPGGAAGRNAKAMAHPDDWRGMYPASYRNPGLAEEGREPQSQERMEC